MVQKVSKSIYTLMIPFNGELEVVKLKESRKMGARAGGGGKGELF